MAYIPTSAVRGLRHSVKKCKAPALTAEEARTMLDAIDIQSPIGLPDRALIGLMVYTFARSVQSSRCGEKMSMCRDGVPGSGCRKGWQAA